MTSLKRIPTGKGYRKNHAEQEREQFERSQEASFRKAINDDDVPIKMKHVRTLIIGTHTDKSGAVFWRLVALTPPIHTDITAWKFCHTIHLLSRDGHPKFIRDSIENMGRIQTLGEHFRHLPVGYGNLIKCYCELLITKLSFHDHFPNSPGNLQITSELLTAITENDANNYFQMAVEILDYMEKILNLYESVFHSLNPSRSNSMTKTGQCRLAPLILCIQDSSCLYDLIVRILFQLHKGVAPDMLSGHRKRFNSQFKLLQQFYNSTRNLQYFKMLVQVPHLPQNPPNLLVESELRTHVAPVVVLEEEQPDVTDSVLVDTSEPEPPPIPPHPHPDVVNSHNGSMVDVMTEKESLIDALQHELRLIRTDVQKERSEASYVQEQLRLRINDLESSIGELDSELMAEKKSKESILAQFQAAAASADAVAKLSEEETKRRVAEQKFSKIKEVYQKLREEHINLIRAKSDMEKMVSVEKEKARLAKEKRDESERAINQLEAQLSEKQELESSVLSAQEEAKTMSSKLDDLNKTLGKLSEENDSLQSLLNDSQQKQLETTQHLETQFIEHKQNLKTVTDDCVGMSCENGISLIEFSLRHFDVSAHSLIKVNPEYTLIYSPVIDNILDLLGSHYKEFLQNPLLAPRLVGLLQKMAHYLSSFLLYGKGSSHASTSIEVADNLVTCLELLGSQTIAVLKSVGNQAPISDAMDELKATLLRATQLVEKCEDATPSQEDIEMTVQREMEAMDQAIGEAVEKFTNLLMESRAKDSGMQLEVNENILGTCGELMAAVRILVEKSSALQKEIVAAGKGGASPREFYKRNHRWTEGLISGAKTVALACQALVHAADQVANNKGKFEEVIVASREIAASSMQLVMASRVKADRASQKLSDVNNAARNISTLTGTVVATAETCREKLTESTTLDFSKLSLHSTKMLEMEIQVKMLETEKQLETERTKLAELRRHHYKLAGEIQEDAE